MELVALVFLGSARSVLFCLGLSAEAGAQVPGDRNLS